MVFTDFISKDEYAALLKSCDVVMCLTKENYTNQSGAYEAMAAGKPIITSDWPFLRNTYSKGTLYVDNTAESLTAAVEELQSNYALYCRQIEMLRKERHQVWQKNFQQLMASIDG